MAGALLLGRIRTGGRLACPTLTTMDKERPIAESRASIPDGGQKSEAGFASLLAALGDTPQAAGQQYELLRAKLVFFFARKSLQFPEDLADEVLDRVGRRLSEGLVISSVNGFALGVARYVGQEQAARRHQHLGVDPSYFDNIPATSATFNEDERVAYLERCLRKLPAKDKHLLSSYYLGQGGSSISARRHMAERFGVSSATLRQRVFLIRQRMLACVKASQERQKK